jgi:hypothetical protein
MADKLLTRVAVFVVLRNKAGDPYSKVTPADLTQLIG